MFHVAHGDKTEAASDCQHGKRFNWGWLPLLSASNWLRKDNEPLAEPVQSWKTTLNGKKSLYQTKLT